MRTSLAIFVALLTTAAMAKSPASGLPGLWGVKQVFGPEVKGTLVIDGRASPWRAHLAGFSVAVARDKQQVQFSLPDGQGSFRGKLSGDAASITGQWIQPPNVTLSNAFATPVVLHVSEAGVWQGAVRPLPDSLTLYLLVDTADAGLTGDFRNPDFNFGRDNPYSINTRGDQVSLISTRNKRDAFQAIYKPGTNILALQLPMLGRTLDLTKRTRNAAVGFYPETPPAQGFSYRVPLSMDDGWEVDTPESVGLHLKPLKGLIEHVFDTRYQGFHTPYIHSLLIARHGKLVLEQYFYGHEREQVHDMRSASKTFAGVLVGLALQHGATFKLDTPVYSLFPEYKAIKNMDTRKKAITVKDLLTMTSSLACDDNDEQSPGNEDRMQSQDTQPDWYKYTLDLPVQREPGGTHAVYCSAAINLLGGVVRNTLNVQLPEFFYKYFAQPLEMRDYHINLMPTGEAYMGGGMRLRPRDQLKLGQLYLDEGEWHGQQVIARNWVKQSLREYSEFAPDHHYGFAWHIVELKAGGKTYRVEEAGGNGGQFVIVIPDLDMVVGITAGNYGDFSTWYKFMTELVPKYIIPAAELSAG